MSSPESSPNPGSSPAPPQHCRREAFDYFVEQMPVLNRTDGLCRAAVAISMHALEDLHPQSVEQQLWTIAGRVADRVQSDNPHALLAHLHAELFDHLQLRGNEQDYDQPENSYLSCVLERGMGIPISLSLVYKAVAERVGLRVVGLNAPGHFLVGIAMPASGGEDKAATLMIIDPFFRGRVLTPQEAAERAGQYVPYPVPDDPMTMLPAATHAQWLMRMLINLQHQFEHHGCKNDWHAVRELRAVLESAAEQA